MKTTARMVSLALVLLLAASAAAGAAADLSGTWVLDRAQSQVPAHGDKGAGASGGAQNQTPPAEVKLIVVQQGDTLKVTRTTSRTGKERSFTETITANGTEQTETRRHGTTVSKATWNGDQLVVTQSSNMTTPKGERQMSRQSVWSVSPDGHTLTIETTFNGPRGERSMKTVYVKS